MGRLNLEINNDTLDILVPKYADTKANADMYKKDAEAQNNKIKELLKEANTDNYTAGGYTVKMTTSVRESFNEDKLINLIHSNTYSLPDVCAGISLDDPTLGIIKTREYVDMDALENAIYKGLIPQEVLLKMNDCKETKEVVTLRVTKEKKKEETDNE